MATPLKIIGQHALDLFLQDYKGTTQFWSVEDTTYFAGVAYAELLSQEYMLVYKSMQQSGEEDIVTFSHDWLQTETIKVCSDQFDGTFAQLPCEPMSFPYDKRDIGIQNVFPALGKFNGELIRSNINTIWMDELLPQTDDIYWSLLKDKLILKFTRKTPPPALRVVFVPSVNENLLIPDTRANAMIQMTVDLMRKSKDGNLIKETNDQNKNTAPQTEMDRNLIKA